MNEQQKTFFQLVKQYETLKDGLSTTRSALELVMAVLGVGTIVQDEETGLVYKITKPTGTFVNFKSIDYDRTAKEGESRGTLSKKEAREAGFDVE